jgi:lipoate-protein ligase A
VRPATPPDDWLVTETFGTARDLHDRPLAERPAPEIWIHHVEAPALVLGSSQSEDDLAEVRTELCRRRSGGGIVGLIPGNDLWIDLILPTSSRLWNDDVGVAGAWVGSTWQAALESTLTEVTANALPICVHRGPLLHRTAGRLVCFAGLGPGEVTVGGNKVVGLSQRRTRRAARFQTVMTWSWPGEWLASMLADDAVGNAGLARSQVVSLAAGLPDEILRSPRCPTVEGVTSSFLENLPEP